MIEVFGIPHFPSAGEYSAGIIFREKPKIVCIEMHSENLEKLTQLMKKVNRSIDEEKSLKLAAGDGLVAIVEASWQIGAKVFGLEPKKEGYAIYKHDYKTGLEGKFWKFLDELWGRIAGYFDEKGEEKPEIYQTSFWAPKVEGVRRWIWKHECFPAYQRVSLEREETYASKLVQLEKEKGKHTKIFFFVGGGHKWNTLKEIARIKR